MRPQRLWAVASILLLVGLVAVQAEAQSTNKYRLKPGADGKNCFNCHPDFETKIKSKFVHTPVKAGECTACHSPHASNHGKLLSASPSTICMTCHDGLIPTKAVSTHKVVLEGKCVACHDPHGSPNKANLVRAGNELCVTCHKGIGDAIVKAKFRHIPVADGCLNCHNPHASETSAHLLTSAVPALCLACHKADGPRFVSQHAGYPVAKANCATCHNPHGSSNPGILSDTVHPPVAAKRCSQCHNAADAAEPFATRRPGFELCRGCHGSMMNDVFSKSRVHWPLVDERGCLNCHQPHAARKPKLLNVEPADLCGQCHRDTMAWQARLAERVRQEKETAPRSTVQKGALAHPPVQAGDCLACHLPHASDATRLMRQASIVDLCGSCHDWLKHNSHPMGGKYVDLRNKNLPVNCLSCHRSHGTGNRYMITFPTPTQLCVQCHTTLRR